MIIASLLGNSYLFIKTEIMKTLFFLLFGLGFSAAVMAQATDPQKKAEMKDLRGDAKAHAAAKHKMNKDLSHGKISKAIDDHKTVHRINKDEHADAKRMKDQGVSHPITKAKRANKVHDDSRKDHTQ